MSAEARVVRSPRMKERRRAVHAEIRRRRRRISLAVVLGLSVCAGMWTVAHSSLVALAGVDVVGVRSLTVRQVIAASGLRAGESALRVDLVAVAARVRALPEVASASAVREGTTRVRILVEERAPTVEVRAGRQRIVLDQSGLPVERVGTAGRIPVVNVRGGGVNLEKAFSLPAVRASVSLWPNLPERFRRRITSFDVVPEDGRVAFIMKGVRVVFGKPEHIRAKVRALDLVRRRAAARGWVLRSVDVSVPGRPAIRLA